ARRERLLRPAREVAFFEIEILEHLLRDGDVLRLSAVRRARERELVITPADAIEAARLEQRHDLERLRARAPERHERRIARAADEAVAADHGGVHAVPGLDTSAARRDDVEVEGAHDGKLTGADR